MHNAKQSREEDEKISDIEIPGNHKVVSQCAFQIYWIGGCELDRLESDSVHRERLLYFAV